MEILDLKLSVIYKVLKILEEKDQLLVSEIIALTGSSTFHQKYLPYLEKIRIRYIRKRKSSMEKRYE